MSEKQEKFLKAIRQALLMMVDAIEELLGMERTSELRRKVKELSREIALLSVDIRRTSV